MKQKFNKILNFIVESLFVVWMGLFLAYILLLFITND